MDHIPTEQKEGNLFNHNYFLICNSFISKLTSYRDAKIERQRFGGEIWKRLNNYKARKICEYADPASNVVSAYQNVEP